MGAVEPGAQRLDAVSPFVVDSQNEGAYQRWRLNKLNAYPRRVEALLVPVRDMRRLDSEELAAIGARVKRCNMAVYQCRQRQDGLPVAQQDAEASHLRALGEQLGLGVPDGNWLAEEDGVSRIEVVDDSQRAAKPRGEYIPYTDRPIRWHTDGYYHPPERRIRAMALHCVRPAQTGGENSLLDHELLYILLRDQNPEHIRALMAEDALTIPARVGERRVERPTQTGPVFWLDKHGALFMRYTDRTQSIVWKDDAATLAAVEALKKTLKGAAAPWVFHLKLKAGMGVLCNNVLHARSGFSDGGGASRLLYRARYTRGMMSH